MSFPVFGHPGTAYTRGALLRILRWPGLSDQPCLSPWGSIKIPAEPQQDPLDSGQIRGLMQPWALATLSGFLL